MNYASTALADELNRQQLAERTRTRVPKIPATAHRHLLVQRLRRLNERPDG